MKHSDKHDEGDFILTFQDICHIIKKHKRRILRAAIVCGALGLLFALTRPIVYHAEATFKEKTKSYSDFNQSIGALLINAEINESDALIMMQSRRLTEELVKSSGLQVEIKAKVHSFPLVPFKTIKDNLLVEFALLTARSAPILRDETPPLAAQNVVYDEESPRSLQIIFSDDDRFEVQDSAGKLLTVSTIASPASFDEVAFTLIKKSTDSLAGSTLKLTLHPLGETTKTISKRFHVETDRKDPSLIKISYDNPNRFLAAKHANTLMDLYKAYTLQEHQRMCNAQIDYLQDRQANMGMQLEKVMQSHANDLSSDLSSTGFVNYDSAITFLNSNQQTYKQKLQAIQLETEWLKQAQTSGHGGGDTFTPALNSDLINQLIKEMRELSHEADSITFALKKSSANENNNLDASNTSTECQGIDLLTAKQLYLAYSKDLNELEAKSAEYHFLISQIQDPDFEISSLSSVLSDPISNEMINKSGQLILALKDMDNRTHKEQDRLKAGLALNKEFFITHLTQTIQLNELRQLLMKEKIETLQKVTLSLIHERVSILASQIATYTSQRLEDLKREKDLYQQNLLQIREEMAVLPRKWMSEQLIQKQMNLNQTMTEEISKLVESKNLSSNLEKTQSTPIDLSLIPIHPKPPHLTLFAIVGALSGVFLVAGWTVFKSAINGIEATALNLRLNGHHVSGVFSRNLTDSKPLPTPMLDSELDAMRRLICYMDNSSDGSGKTKGNVLLLLCNQGPNYAENLATLLFKRNNRTLIIDLCFDDSLEQTPRVGMLEYMEGLIEKPPICHHACYDAISGFGATRFTNEFIAGEKFNILLNSLKQEYDWIVLTSQAQLLSAEAEHLLVKFSKAAVTIRGESLQALHFGILKHPGCLSFIVIEETHTSL